MEPVHGRVQLKIIHLIIASPGEAYDQFKLCIHKHLCSLQPFVTHFFLYGKNKYQTAHVLSGYDLVFDCNDAYGGGITLKTALACNHILKNNIPFDFCVRTNLSAIFPHANLTSIMSKLPREKCYAGIIGKYKGKGHKYVSGAGMILSPDVIHLISLLAENKMETQNDKLSDDVRIGQYLGTKGIYPDTPTGYIRECVTRANIKILAYNKITQLRFKTRNRKDDAAIMNQVVKVYL